MKSVKQGHASGFRSVSSFNTGLLKRSARECFGNVVFYFFQEFQELRNTLKQQREITSTKLAKLVLRTCVPDLESSMCIS